MSTNGHKATPSREQIIREATYQAAVYGYYDTSEAAQQANLLTINIVDIASLESLPTEVTHKFFVMVSGTDYMVTRYYDGHYEIAPYDQTDLERKERRLRESVLDAALWYLTGEGAGYQVGAGPEARTAAIKELLEDHPEDEQKEREATDPQPHAVVRDELLDLTLSLAPGLEGGSGPQPLRQWSIEIGPSYSCEVALFGYDEDGSPVLVPLDTELEGEPKE